MAVLALLGFLAIIFSICYVIFYFIKKTVDSERTISKKIFYPTLIGDLLFFIIGISSPDTVDQNQFAAV